MAHTNSADRVISFGTFRLFPRKRLLLDAEKSLRIGGRALDILIALVERPGELLSKHALIARVWPNTVVEEGNLKVHVAGLRRVLGDGRGGARYLINVPGRGYRFVAPVAISDESGLPAMDFVTASRHNLPVKLTRLIGRREIIDNLAQQLSMQRLLTIVGSGGIGKTAVALDVAEEALFSYAHGAWLIDLARIAEPRLVPTALASALGREVRSDDPLPSLIASLRDKQMLLVLDNCEHVIDAAATMATEVLKGAHAVRILATSREPLRLEGEQVHRLPPLESPTQSAGLSANEALRFPAVQLFAECAAATVNDFKVTDENAASVAHICRELDGIPLAIEFAAARVDAFGIHGLVAGLDDRLRILTRGRRGDHSRHQTIAAALDWSHQLLSQEEQTVFRHLAVFAGGFTHEAASAVATAANTSGPNIADAVANLVIKSLVAADLGDRDARFRLLETTRAYAMAKLVESGEADALRRNHAVYYRDLLEAVLSDSDVSDTASAFAPEIDNIRAALTWSFEPGGDRSLGVELAAASGAIWLGMSLLTECRFWMEKAIGNLGVGRRDTRCEMLLYEALAASLTYTRGFQPETGEAWTKALRIAETLEDTEHRLRTLMGFWGYRLTAGEYEIAETLARQFCDVAKSTDDPANLLIGDRMIGWSLHWLGDQHKARHCLDRVLNRYVAVSPRSDINRFRFDQRVLSRAMLARVLWMQGFPDQAMSTAHMAAVEAEALDHAVSRCIVLAGSLCQVSLYVGDLVSAERAVARLLHDSSTHGLVLWQSWGRSYEAVIRVKRGDIENGLRLLRTTLIELRELRSDVRYLETLGELAEAFGLAGDTAEGLATIDEAVTHSERAGGRWAVAELLRIKGELLQQSGTTDISEAESCLQKSIDWARRQGALSWELRATSSLARLWHQQGRTIEARELLLSVYRRFEEGFETADLQYAKRLLEGDLGSADDFPPRA